MMSLSRRRFLASSLSAVLGATSVAACSKSPAPASGAASSSAAAEALPATSAATPAGPLKVAFAYVGPVGDAGWTFAHDRARKEVQAEFGDKVVTSFVENVPEAA